MIAAKMIASILPLYIIFFFGWYLKNKEGFDESYWEKTITLIWKYLYLVVLFCALSRMDLATLNLTKIVPAMVQTVFTAFLLLLLAKKLFKNSIDNSAFTGMFNTSVRELTYIGFAVITELTGETDALVCLSVIIFVDTIISGVGGEFSYVFWGQEPDANESKDLKRQAFDETEALIVGKNDVRKMYDFQLMFLFLAFMVIWNLKRFKKWFWLQLTKVVLAFIKAFLKPVSVACIIGILTAAVRPMVEVHLVGPLEPLKVFFQTLFQIMMWLTGGCICFSLLTIGASLPFGFKEYKSLKEVKIWLPLVINLLLLPMFAYWYGVQAGLSDENLLKLTVYYALPGSVSAYIMSRFHKKSPEQVATTLALQIKTSIVTLPIIISMIVNGTFLAIGSAIYNLLVHWSL